MIYSPPSGEGGGILLVQIVFTCLRGSYMYKRGRGETARCGVDGCQLQKVLCLTEYEIYGMMVVTTTSRPIDCSIYEYSITNYGCEDAIREKLY